MSQRRYDQGVLVEEWDDEELVYRRFANGEMVQQRPYTQEEARAPVQRRERLEAEQRTQTLRDQLADGIESIRAARDAASQDAAKAEDLRAQAVTARAAAVQQRTAVLAFVPSDTYSADQLVAVRDAIADVLDRVQQTQSALIEFYSYRRAVDDNAVLTDDALLWLARIASGVI